MKMKTLATALTVSVPMLFGTVYAQQTTTPDSGNNRSAAGNAVTTNPAPEPGAGSSITGSSNTGRSGEAATAGEVSGAAATGTSAGTGTAGTGNAADATRDTAKPSATAPGMERRQSDSVASTEAITGWSAKDDMMGKSVFNENDEKIGDIDDIVISSDGRTTYLLIGAGGFLGMGSKNVAVPFDRFQRQDDRILLSGYTKEQLKALPEVRTQR